VSSGSGAAEILRVGRGGCNITRQEVPQVGDDPAGATQGGDGVRQGVGREAQEVYNGPLEGLSSPRSRSASGSCCNLFCDHLYRKRPVDLGSDGDGGRITAGGGYKVRGGGGGAGVSGTEREAGAGLGHREGRGSPEALPNWWAQRHC
jgi:hypothetical protein